MGHSYASCIYHVVWTTKDRRKLLSEDVRERLWKYIGGIARENKMKVLAVGGVDDHIHVLISIPSTVPVSKAMQLLKGGSSKWIHETFPALRQFAWQEGYGAFSIGVSGVAVTTKYIESQELHHQTRSFEDEFLSFLEKHGIEFDAKYVFG